jgi:hypothetical protein
MSLFAGVRPLLHPDIINERPICLELLKADFNRFFALKHDLAYPCKIGRIVDKAIA